MIINGGEWGRGLGRKVDRILLQVPGRPRVLLQRWITSKARPGQGSKPPEAIFQQFHSKPIQSMFISLFAEAYLGAMCPGPLWKSRGSFFWLWPLVPSAARPPAGSWKGGATPARASRGRATTPSYLNTYRQLTHWLVEMRNLTSQKYQSEARWLLQSQLGHPEISVLKYKLVPPSSSF